MNDPESARLPDTINLNDEESVNRVLMETVFGMWDIVDNLTRLRPSRRERYRVTIFGSARIHPGHWVYAEVKAHDGGAGGNGLRYRNRRWSGAHAGCQ